MRQVKSSTRLIASVLVVMGVFALAARADEIVREGVIGNSGAQGRTLVRFSKDPAKGMGVVRDRFGSLWDRGGGGVLNRYAVDGRLLATYKLPARGGGSDKLTIAGDTLVMLIGSQLYKLDVADKGAKNPEELKIRAEKISFGSANGRIACVDKERRLFWLDPAAGRREDIMSLQSLGRAGAPEVAPDAAIYIEDGSRMRKVVGGKLVDGWVRSKPGERAQLIDGVWFAHGWHGTIKRFDADLQPAPGVVLGGASGHFIGHLPQNSELINGRGMAKVGRNLYAVSGMGGVMHLLEWRPKRRKMAIVRRIGALPAIGGIGLDRQGRIWSIAGNWEWSDRPDSPMRFGVNAPEAPGIGQAVMLENDTMLAPGRLWGGPAFYAGSFDKEIAVWRIDKGKCNMRKGFVGSAVYKRDGKTVLLTTDAKGQGQAFYIGGDGRFRDNAGDVKLKTGSPVKQWTTLAMKGPDVLLAAGDGYVIEFARDGADWTEKRRWNSWAGDAASRFGRAIYITADDGRLWVADSARHRTVCLNVSSGKLIATFGTADKKGDGPASLSTPRSIAARGRRAVVFDSDNQRLVKLRLR